ncbi:hypothetical protein IJG14_09020 [bacterium]|nr:hypothetical protein [bacterium]
MNKLIKIFILFLTLSLVQNVSYCTVENANKNSVEKNNIEKNITYTTLQTPTVMVNNPYAFLNKYVQFPAKFNKFSTLGLDYTPAKRESQVYIGVLINRDDVVENIIPLSELKMFIKRKDAEKLTDIEAGDSIMIKGKVFSAALGDPWMDIIEIKVLTPKNKETQKTGK